MQKFVEREITKQKSETKSTAMIQKGRFIRQCHSRNKEVKEKMTNSKSQNIITLSRKSGKMTKKKV